MHKTLGRDGASEKLPRGAPAAPKIADCRDQSRTPGAETAPRTPPSSRAGSAAGRRSASCSLRERGLGARRGPDQICDRFLEEGPAAEIEAELLQARALHDVGRGRRDVG